MSEQLECPSENKQEQSKNASVIEQEQLKFICNRAGAVEMPLCNRVGAVGMPSELEQEPLEYPL